MPFIQIELPRNIRWWHEAYGRHGLLAGRNSSNRYKGNTLFPLLVKYTYRINLFDLVFDTIIFLFSVVAFGGIFGNVASCYILSRREMRNSFNLLLVMLSVYDTFYLLFAVLDSCRKFFEVVIQKEKQIYFHLCKHIKNITLMIDAFNLKCRLKDKQLCKWVHHRYSLRIQIFLKNRVNIFAKINYILHVAL